MSKKTVLMILDGWGIAKDKSVSAIDKAHTPFVDSLYSDYPNTRVEASGLAVGLPEGQMGNSEVGHMNLGAGRIVYQDLVKINLAAVDGSLALEKTLIEAFNIARSRKKKLHFIGLLSDGGVHSHINHLIALIKAADEAGVEQSYIHAFMDGRDTDPQGGKKYIQELESYLSSSNSNCKIASIIGRYYAMDRDQRWERIKLAYDLLVNPSKVYNGSPIEALESSYAIGITDEFVKPHSFITNNEALIEEGDVVISFNFRTDRGRQITMALTQKDFHEQNMHALDLHYVTLTRYDDSFRNINIVFEKDNLTETLGEVLEKNGKKQIRIAETEKYPHVSFFFSGGRETPFDGEKRLLCPSPKVATYDLKPEMSAFEIRDKIIVELQNQSADFVCLNFANPDMVGHTGVMEAAIKACETVDSCVESVVKAGLDNDYCFIILADHGNSDCMLNKDGSPNTAHTTQPVPCFIVGAGNLKLKEGVLGDVAPTVLELMEIAQPQAMSGKSIIVK